jgi:hypothetical protein
MRPAASFALALLTGCSALPETFENRLVYTAACDEVDVISWWGPFGLASKISPKDLGAGCPKGTQNELD